MLTQERYQAILKLLGEKKAVTVSELTEFLNISESTVRRDLSSLAQAGKLNKVFGGATVLKQSSGIAEAAVSCRENLMSAEKNAIAAYAASLINDTDFVYIDAGTTTSRLIDHINNVNATYVTNGISHARKLINKGLKAYMAGGKMKPVTEAVVGAQGIASIKNFNFTKSFMGTNGMDIEAGYTTPDIEEAQIKQAAINKSYVAFILADHSKFHKVFSVTFSPLKKCCIITDKIADKRFTNKTVVKEVNI